MCQSMHETWWKDKILKLSRCPLSIEIQAAHLVGPLDLIQNCGGSYNVFHLMYKNVNCEGTDSKNNAFAQHIGNARTNQCHRAHQMVKVC